MSYNYREYISAKDLINYRSNWDQADDNNVDFIINKPFGRVQSNYTSYLLPEDVYTFEFESEQEIYTYRGTCPYEMIGEQTFKINNITYNQATKQLQGTSYIGNLALFMPDMPDIFPDTGEDYLVITIQGDIMILYKQAYDTDIKDFTVYLFGYYIENKTLSEQYLPKILTLSQLNYTHYGTDIPANVITSPQNGQIYLQLVEPEALIIWLYNGEKWFKTN